MTIILPYGLAVNTKGVGILLTVGSLFSGIGGIDLGLEMTGGFEIKWQVEIDDWCQRVLSKHWPDVPKFRDIRECGRWNLEPVDLVCGGFPCQPHSVAGKRQASADERDLWPEFNRIIGEIRPKWVLAENVPGLLSSDNGRFFGGILRDLAASGYDAEWDCIPASAIGAPHRRDRVWIVAYPIGLRDRGWNIQDGDGREVQVAGSGTGNQQEILAYPTGVRCDGYQQISRGIGKSENQGWMFKSARGGEDMAQSTSLGLEGTKLFGIRNNIQSFLSNKGWWGVEPDVGRVANGIPDRVHRLKGLGNAVVPQNVALIGRMILAAERGN